MSYSGPETAKIVGISYRQLDYWERTDLVKPSLREARGSGSRRSYGYSDLVELCIVKAMLDAGMHLTAVRKVLLVLQAQPALDLGRTSLVITDNTVRLCDEDALVEVVRSHSKLLYVLPLWGVVDDLDEALHPAHEVSTAV